jgi:general secretion pathway protein G
MMNVLNQKLNNSKTGMTLIEIMLVLVLLGFVVSFFAKDLFGVFGGGQRKAAKLAIASIGEQLNLYRLDCSAYPTTEQGLEALASAPSAGRQCPNYAPRGYLSGKKKLPTDPWGNPFKYESNGQEYTLKSLGPDGAEGGDGDNKDISSADE